MRKGIIKNCLACNKEFYVKQAERLRRKNCSRICADKLKDFSGEKNPKWNGGIKIHGYGYRLIASPNHPFKDKQGYVREHRLIMEAYIGRYLTRDELIHHLDHDKLNNHIENLIIISRSNHKKLHPEIGMATRFQKGHVNYATR